MIENDKIYVSEYLKDLNERSKHAAIYHHIRKDSVKPLTCKELASKCGVTAATISNLTTSSKFFLLDKIATEILDSYYALFVWEEMEERKENPDCMIYPRDKNYVLMYLTNYYSSEWLNDC